MVILVVLACLAMLGGAIFYNPLRRRMAGIIGVGGAYIVLIGVMLVIMCIGQLFGAAGAEANGTEIVMSVVFMVLALGYMVFVMLTRCSSASERILLPLCRLPDRSGLCMAAAGCDCAPHPHGKWEDRAEIRVPRVHHFAGWRNLHPGKRQQRSCDLLLFANRSARTVPGCGF